MTHPIPRIAPAATDPWEVEVSMDAADLHALVQALAEIDAAAQKGAENVTAFNYGRWTVRFRRRERSEQ